MMVRRSPTEAGSRIIHFDARPEGRGRPVVPCVDDTCSDMFALRGDLFTVGSFLDVDGKLLVRPALRELSDSEKYDRDKTNLTCSVVRRGAAIPAPVRPRSVATLKGCNAFAGVNATCTPGDRGAQ